MADFLTRLLERTQGTIPGSRLAQPQLGSMFAPTLMSLEPSIEIHEERDASSAVSPSGEQSKQELSRAKHQNDPYAQLKAMQQPIVHSSVEVQAREPFEIPVSSEQTPHYTYNVSQQFQRQKPVEQEIQLAAEVQSEQDVAHQETMSESVEDTIVEPTAYNISYSRSVITSHPLSASTSQPSSGSQADGTQASQVHALNEELDSSRMSDNMMGTEELKENTFEEHELLIKTQQLGVLIEQQTALPFMGLDDARAGSGKFEDSEESTFTENTVGETKEHSQTLEREQQMHGLLLPQQHVSQNVVQVPAQKGSEQVIDTSSEQKLETLISQEEMHVVSPLNVPPLYTSSVQTSSNPLMNEQEHVERIVVTRPSQEEVTREAVLREESVRVQREVLFEVQEHIIEQVQQEQARRSDVLSQRRIIPTQGHVARQEQITGLSVKESMTPPVTQIVPPTIQVSIGRIEVRAVTAATPTLRPKPARPSPSLSLEEYLKQQRGGR